MSASDLEDPLRGYCVDQEEYVPLRSNRLLSTYLKGPIAQLV